MDSKTKGKVTTHGHTKTTKLLRIQYDPLDCSCDNCGATAGKPCQGLNIGYVHEERWFTRSERIEIRESSP